MKPFTRFRLLYFLLVFSLPLLLACETDNTESGVSGGDPDAAEAETSENCEADAEPWEFNRDDYDLVNGWILLDDDAEAVRDSIKTAALYGVNHIQLSHDLIMEIEDIIGNDDESLRLAELLNLGITLAHEHDMKAYIWSHEFSGTGINICYGPEGDVWGERKEAYRKAFEKLPGLDGVVMMFGSAPMPPWFTLCPCEWCEENYGTGLPLEIPPQDERIRITVENIGGVIVNEFGKELFIRTFVHRPEEIDWHGDGLAAARGVEFTGMHKGPVQDWQPYNPHHPNLGHIGEHPSIMELDLAGEYYGLSILPFCAPGYYRYRLKHLWENRGIGAVLRVQRGSYHALGTPNEINMYAISELIENMEKPLEEIWDEFLLSFYGLDKENQCQPKLKEILKDTFPIRLKSHYVLGIWAMEKGSNPPTDTELDQFRDRGGMPKWDPDWQDVWDSLARPDRQTVVWIWQEGSESVELADESLEKAAELEGCLSPERFDDLHHRLKHQKYAAEVWRAIELFIWANMAKSLYPADSDLPAWQKWAYEELGRIKEAMTADGLGGVQIASPGLIQAFLNNTADKVPTDAAASIPDVPVFSPIETISTGADQCELSFTVSRGANVTVEYGLDIPDYGRSIELGQVEADKPKTFTLSGLAPGKRHVVRLKSTIEGKLYLGGDFWIFLPAM